MKKIILIISLILVTTIVTKAEYTVNKIYINFTGKIVVTYDNNTKSKLFDSTEIVGYSEFISMLRSFTGESLKTVMYTDTTLGKVDKLIVRSINNNWFIGVYEKIKFCYGLNSKEREIFLLFLQDIVGKL